MARIGAVCRVLVDVQVGPGAVDARGKWDGCRKEMRRPYHRARFAYVKNVTARQENLTN